MDPRDELAEISRKLGADESLVLAGGGNTSCKVREPDRFGRARDLLVIKPSGVDLATIEPGDFSTLRLDDLLPMGDLDALSDEEMMQAAMEALVDPAMRRPSLEVLLHALLPDRWVLHSHADALLALTNHPQGEERVRAALGGRVAIVPYMRPGFELSRAVAAARGDAEGIVLLKHGLVTMGETAEEAYERHVSRVAACAEAAPVPKLVVGGGAESTAREWAPLLRGALGGGIVRWDRTPPVMGFLDDERLVEAVQRGPATADHVLRVGRAPVVVRDAGQVPEGRKLLLVPGTGLAAHGATVERADENLRIGRHTLQTVAACGPEWEPLNDEQLRHVEQSARRGARRANWPARWR